MLVVEVTWLKIVNTMAISFFDEKSHQEFNTESSFRFPRFAYEYCVLASKITALKTELHFLKNYTVIEKIRTPE